MFPVGLRHVCGLDYDDGLRRFVLGWWRWWPARDAGWNLHHYRHGRVGISHTHRAGDAHGSMTLREMPAGTPSQVAAGAPTALAMKRFSKMQWVRAQFNPSRPKLYDSRAEVQVLATHLLIVRWP